MTVSVCPCVVEDAAALAILNESCFGFSYPVHETASQIKSILKSADEQLLVAVYRGTMLGYIHLRVDRRTYRAPRLAVAAVAVDKNHRRKGVAKALFAAALELADRLSCEAVTASVGGSRAAQSFFLAVGCEERLNRKQFFKRLDDTERKA